MPSGQIEPTPQQVESLMGSLYRLTEEQMQGLGERLIRMSKELIRGQDQDPEKILTPTYPVPENFDQVVLLRDIPFNSLCEHHLLPVSGRAHIAYIPRKKLIGLSKLARILHCFALRPQLQERLTVQVAQALWNALEPLGVGVLIEAQHACISTRGVVATGATMVTSKLLGYFRDDARTREEFLALTVRRS